MPTPIRPNFLVIGAQKCGTTSFCELLARHPKVFMPADREPHYFALDALFEERGAAWYESLFAEAGDATAVGEGSTSYTMHMHRPEAAARIARTLPDARLLYLVREPLRRIESHYLHLVRTRRTRADFATVLHENPYMVDTSLYWKQIGLYREHFPDERIRVVFLDELERDPEAVAAGCFRFLGVPDSPEAVRLGHQNASGEAFDSAVGARLRSLPGSRALANALPKSVRRFAKRVMSSAPPERPVWTDDLLHRVQEQIRPDAEAFTRFYRDDPGYWTLEPSAPAS